MPVTTKLFCPGCDAELIRRPGGRCPNCGEDVRVAVSIHIQYISPAAGSLVAVAHRVADNGRDSIFRVMVYEGERFIAVFDGVAIKVNPARR